MTAEPVIQEPEWPKLDPELAARSALSVRPRDPNWVSYRQKMRAEEASSEEETAIRGLIETEVEEEREPRNLELHLLTLAHHRAMQRLETQKRRAIDAVNAKEEQMVKECKEEEARIHEE